MDRGGRNFDYKACKSRAADKVHNTADPNSVPSLVVTVVEAVKMSEPVELE